MPSNGENGDISLTLKKNKFYDPVLLSTVAHLHELKNIKSTKH